MPLLRHLLLFAAAITGFVSTFLPLQEVDAGHEYGHSCSDPIRLAGVGLFIPSSIIMLIAAARLLGARRSELADLPRAVIARASSLGARLHGRIAELDERLAARGRLPRSCRVAGWLALVVGLGLIAPGCDGPGKYPGGLAHLLASALVLWSSSPPASRKGSAG